MFEESFDHGEQSLKETLENINKERALQQAAFLELINKLKPSLGHHENVHLLKSLNEEMEELMKRLNNSQIMEEMSKLDVLNIIHDQCTFVHCSYFFFLD